MYDDNRFFIFERRVIGGATVHVRLVYERSSFCGTEVPFMVVFRTE